MSNEQSIGQWGEEIAQSYILRKGYQIMETNFRFSHGEVDIIAMKNNMLVFIEVKTRSSDYFGHPEEFVTNRKEKYMAEVAPLYMEKIGHMWEIRFDIISIIRFGHEQYRIRHFEDAFFPGW